MPVHWRLRVLVALPPARDLLVCAKHLFVGARIAWHGLQSLRGEPRPGWPARNHLKVPTMRGCPLLRPSANAITATLAPPDRTPTVLGNCRPRLVGAWYTIVAVRAPAFRAPFARLARLRQLRLLREREHRQQRNRTDDDQYFHDISFAKAATTSPPRRQQCGRAGSLLLGNFLVALPRVQRLATLRQTFVCR